MFPHGSAFFTGWSRLVLLTASLYAFSISSASFFFCSSYLYSDALLGSSAANAGTANDAMIAAIAKALIFDLPSARTFLLDSHQVKLGQNAPNLGPSLRPPICAARRRNGPNPRR